MKAEVKIAVSQPLTGAAALVVAVLVASVSISILPVLCHAQAVVENDDATGELHINSSATGSTPVLVNGVDVLARLDDLQAQASGLRQTMQRLCDGYPSVVSKVPVSSDPDAWSGGVLSPATGMIYGIPHHDYEVLVIDPLSNQISTLTINGVPATSGKWQGGVLALNGKIFGIPQDAEQVLIIDPIAGTANANHIVGLASTTDKWSGGVLAPETGLIYGIPKDADTVLVINPATEAVDSSSLPANRDRSNAWVGGVLANDGKIYGIPHSSGYVLIIDPSNNSTTRRAVAIPDGGNKWAGGVLGPDGRIYFIPHLHPRMLVLTLDPWGRQYIGRFDETERKWFGGALAANGRIYAAPSGSNTVLVVDTATGSTDDSSLMATEETNPSRMWAGVVEGPNGFLYGIPRIADAVLVIDPRCHF